jgi:hypothetical protein
VSVDKSKDIGQRWFEVWADSTLLPYPYLLLVVFENDGFKIIDQKENDKIVLTSENYEEVQNYLSEDEFIIVKGRTNFPPEWWDKK